MSNRKCEFAEYFRQLGYSYSWDFSRASGESWHELFDENDKLVVQVDMKATLQQFVNDGCVVEEIPTNYWIATENNELFDILINKIRKHTGKTWNTAKERDEELNKK